MAALARRESWLAEGIYITWSVPLIESADLVVWERSRGFLVGGRKHKAMVVAAACR